MPQSQNTILETLQAASQRSKQYTDKVADTKADKTTATETANGIMSKEDKQNLDGLVQYTGYADKDVYGVEVDFANNKFTRLGGAVGKQGGHDFDSINAFGGRKRCCIKNDGTVVGYENISGSYTTNGFMADSTTPVQVMVEQPKFYYKVVPVELEDITENGSVIGKVIKKARWYVSDKPKTGFKL